MAEVLESQGGQGVHVPGDWVLPARSMSGTWQSHAVFQESELLSVRQDICVEGAATLMINPATALRMLEDFIPLKVKENDYSHKTFLILQTIYFVFCFKCFF